MLTVILNWFYILFTVFCLGFAFSHFSEKVLRYSFKCMVSVLMAGLIMATVYAQVFSLFYRVNIEANVMLMLVCLVICIILRKKMAEFLRNALLAQSLPIKILIPVLLLLWAYYTSRGYMVYDMDMYHGQSIRWIEEYGVVKGLGNLHNRFGYNSSIFSVSALYSMKFLFGRSMHTVNGVIAFIMALEVLNLGKVFKRRRMLLSDYARVGLLYYMSNVCDEILAPSSDYAVMFTIFFIIIKWLAQLEEEDEERRKNIAPYALLCVAGVHALTLKVTAGLILILLIKPAYMLMKEKRWKEIAIYLGLGLIAAVPWFARNVIITGWLLYPFPSLDLFGVDWKMTDVHNIIIDAEMIKVYAKGLQDVGIGVPFTEWFPHWFRQELYSLEKVFILADILACILLLGIAAFIFAKKKWEKLDVLLVMSTVMSCYLFWQFSAPMMRYGYAHVLLLAMLVYGYLLESIERVKLARVAYAGLALFVAYRIYAGFDCVMSSWWLPNYVWQETYASYELESYQIGGETVYYSPYEDATGYDPFPAAPARQLDIELRGDGLEDGFRRIGN